VPTQGKSIKKTTPTKEKERSEKLGGGERQGKVINIPAALRNLPTVK